MFGSILGDEIDEQMLQRRGFAAKFAHRSAGAGHCAEQGFAKAQFELGNMYTKGDDVIEDDFEAASWYRKAAEQGSMDGQHALGRVYLTGQGVPKDYVRAHLWLSLAKANGDESSDNWLNVITKHMTNDQIAEAERLAREWLEKHGK